MVTDDEKYRAAKAHVGEIRGFYGHLFIFVLVNFLLVAINIIQGIQYLWFYWVTLFWGIGLVMHAISVYGRPTIFGKKWEEKKIQEIMESEKGQNEK